MWYIIIAVIWLIGSVVTWFVVKKWNMKKWEKIWCCILWPCLVPLYIIHVIHNKLF